MSMAAWLIPALKVVLPHVGTIVSAAAPVFTKKKPDAPDQAPLLQQQIGELQAAAAQNAAHVKELAAQLESTVAALDQAARLAESKLRRAFLWCLAAAGISTVALCLVLVFLLTR
jgi:hypothetical protein